MNSAHRAVAFVLIIGALAGSAKGAGGPTSTIGPTNSNGTSVMVGPWNANVQGSNPSVHWACTVVGSLVITQTGTGATATLGANFTGSQTCSGATGTRKDTVAGPISGLQVSGLNIAFADGLGLDYVGTINLATNPTAASGTAQWTLTTLAGPVIMPVDVDDEPLARFRAASARWHWVSPGRTSAAG